MQEEVRDPSDNPFMAHGLRAAASPLNPFSPGLAAEPSLPAETSPHPLGMQSASTNPFEESLPPPPAVVSSNPFEEPAAAAAEARLAQPETDRPQPQRGHTRQMSMPAGLGAGSPIEPPVRGHTRQISNPFAGPADLSAGVVASPMVVAAASHFFSGLNSHRQVVAAAGSAGAHDGSPAKSAGQAPSSVGGTPSSSPRQLYSRQGSADGDGRGRTGFATGVLSDTVLVASRRWLEKADWDAPRCLRCSVRFGRSKRRHVCQYCGLAICAACSAERLQQHPNLRVCSSCFKANQHRSTALAAFRPVPRLVAAGLLVKASERKRTWQERFVIFDSNGMMTYFKNYDVVTRTSPGLKTDANLKSGWLLLESSGSTPKRKARGAGTALKVFVEVHDDSLMCFAKEFDGQGGQLLEAIALHTFSTVQLEGFRLIIRNINRQWVFVFGEETAHEITEWKQIIETTIDSAIAEPPRTDPGMEVRLIGEATGAVNVAEEVISFSASALEVAWPKTCKNHLAFQVETLHRPFNFYADNWHEATIWREVICLAGKLCFGCGKRLYPEQPDPDAQLRLDGGTGDGQESPRLPAPASLSPPEPPSPTRPSTVAINPVSPGAQTCPMAPTVERLSERQSSTSSGPQECKSVALVDVGRVYHLGCFDCARCWKGPRAGAQVASPVASPARSGVAASGPDETSLPVPSTLPQLNLVGGLGTLCCEGHARVAVESVRDTERPTLVSRVEYELLGREELVRYVRRHLQRRAQAVGADDGGEADSPDAPESTDHSNTPKRSSQRSLQAQYDEISAKVSLDDAREVNRLLAINDITLSEACTQLREIRAAQVIPTPILCLTAALGSRPEKAFPNEAFEVPVAGPWSRLEFECTTIGYDGFSQIRKAKGITDLDLIQACKSRPSDRNMLSGGSSGCYLVSTTDEKFVMKNLRGSEPKVLIGLLSELATHAQTSPDSLLVTIVGLWEIKVWYDTSCDQTC